jgi:hypothetical protein
VKRITTIVLAIVICAAGSTMITNANSRIQGPGEKANDAAYRDGLFLGQFDGKRGRVPHVSIGRWSSQPDRDSFAAGYKAGYERASDE